MRAQGAEKAQPALLRPGLGHGLSFPPVGAVRLSHDWPHAVLLAPFLGQRIERVVLPVRVVVLLAPVALTAKSASLSSCLPMR